MPDKKGSDDRAYARGFAAGRAAATPPDTDLLAELVDRPAARIASASSAPGTTPGYGLAPSDTPGEFAPCSVLPTPTSSAQDRMAPQLLRPSEVAEILGVTTRTVRALAERGELVKVKLGRRSARYQLADVERFIERHVVTPDNSESAPQGAPAKGDDGAPRREG